MIFIIYWLHKTLIIKTLYKLCNSEEYSINCLAIYMKNIKLVKHELDCNFIHYKLVVIILLMSLFGSVAGC